MDFDRFIGTWTNKTGNKLSIKKKSKSAVSVSFFSHVDDKPVKRKYFDNSDSVDMHAELDYYEASIEVELWEKGKGFYLDLLHDYIEFKNGESGYYLCPGISRYEEDGFLDQYTYLFDPLEHYKRLE